jgi:hypothetical protein
LRLLDDMVAEAEQLAATMVTAPPAIGSIR